MTALEFPCESCHRTGAVQIGGDGPHTGTAPCACIRDAAALILSHWREARPTCEVRQRWHDGYRLVRRPAGPDVPPVEWVRLHHDRQTRAYGEAALLGALGGVHEAEVFGGLS